MNELERLKRAEEAGAMAVLAMEMPDRCGLCKLVVRDGFSKIAFCAGTKEHQVIPEEYWTLSDWALTDGTENHPDWCPLRPAIGIIELGGHVVYLREKLSCDTCKWNDNECDNSEPYEGKSGYTAGDDWCELYVRENGG